MSPLHVSNTIWWELENRLALGDDARDDSRLQRLRELAAAVKAAVMQGDFGALSSAMNGNTAVQRDMHAGLDVPEFDQAMEIARSQEGIGFKVNGTGGDGDTVAILTDGNMAEKRRLLQRLQADGFTSIPVCRARRGGRAWRSA